MLIRFSPFPVQQWDIMKNKCYFLLYPVWRVEILLAFDIHLLLKDSSLVNLPLKQVSAKRKTLKSDFLKIGLLKFFLFKVHLKA